MVTEEDAYFSKNTVLAFSDFNFFAVKPSHDIHA